MSDSTPPPPPQGSPSPDPTDTPATGAAPPPPPPAPAPAPPAPSGPPAYGQPPAAPVYGQPPVAPVYGQPPVAPVYGQTPAGAPYGSLPGLVPVDSQGRPLAEWWQRAVAIIIDTFILGIVYSILQAIFGGGNTTTVNANGSITVHSGHLIIAELIEIVLTLTYFGLLDGGAKGQTIGKLALGIATRDVNTGGPIGTGRGVLRRFIYGILWIAFFIPGLINVLSPLWDKRRQAWHDKAASSDVIKVR